MAQIHGKERFIGAIQSIDTPGTTPLHLGIRHKLEERTVGREPCRTCEALKELYWLKLNRFLLAARSNSSWPPRRRRVRDEEVEALKEESLAALRDLMRHAKVCYGLVHDEAA